MHHRRYFLFWLRKERWSRAARKPPASCAQWLLLHFEVDFFTRLRCVLETVGGGASGQGAVGHGRLGPCGSFNSLFYKPTGTTTPMFFYTLFYVMTHFRSFVFHSKISVEIKTSYKSTEFSLWCTVCTSCMFNLWPFNLISSSNRFILQITLSFAGLWPN